MGPEFPKRCPTRQRVPLTLLGLAGGTIEQARVGCLCGSGILRVNREYAERPSREAGNVSLKSAETRSSFSGPLSLCALRNTTDHDRLRFAAELGLGFPDANDQNYRFLLRTSNDA